MHLRIILLITCSWLICAACYAQTEKQFPADALYQKCIEKDTSCANIGDCAFIAYNMWDKEMKTAYTKLQKTQKTEKDRLALTQSQTAWEGYRDASFKSYDNMFGRAGSKWCRMRHEYKMDIVRSRTLQLKKYLADLKRK